MRSSEVAGREGKQPDGSAKTREVKICTIWSAEGRDEEARKCHGYITENRKRMAYPDFHAQGLCTSTGVVEAGCRVVVGTRLKRAGMHWTVRGADAIIALRCSRLSGRFEDFWEQRSKCAA